MSHLPLSVFIITYNEADRLSRPIQSVKDLAEEVIVIDSGSTDNTVEIAKELGAKVLHHDWEGYGKQKRFGEEQCRHDWVLNLDADEELTPESRAEIKKLLAVSAPSKSAYRLPLYDLLPGESKVPRFAHVNAPIRLYNKQVVRFSESPVHDSVAVPDNGAGTLQKPSIHRSFRSLEHAIAKMNAYTTVQAEEIHRNERNYPNWRLYTELPITFFKAYILRGYITRGRRGFVFSVMHAYGRFVRLAKVLEVEDK